MCFDVIVSSRYVTFLVFMTFVVFVIIERAAEMISITLLISRFQDKS